jgi:hypothetical protein
MDFLRLTKRHSERLRSFLKDFGGHIIGAVAIILSVFSLYHSMHVVDDFRFTIGGDRNIPNPDPDAKRIILYGPKVLTFINSGTRPVATLDVKLMIYQTAVKDPPPTDCPAAQSKIIRPDVGPFVVKAGDISIVQVLFDRNSGAEIDKSGNPTLALNEDMFWTALCFMFDLATPDNITSTVVIPLMSCEYSEAPGGCDMFFDWSQPIRLIPR